MAKCYLSSSGMISSVLPMSPMTTYFDQTTQVPSTETRKSRRELLLLAKSSCGAVRLGQERRIERTRNISKIFDALDAFLMTIIRDLIMYCLNMVLIYLLLPYIYQIDKQIKGLDLPLSLLELHDRFMYCDC